MSSMKDLPSYQLWSHFHLNELEKTSTYREIGDVALDAIRSMPTGKKRLMVCAPMSDNRERTREENMDIFYQTLQKVEQQNKYHLFNQSPLGEAIERIFPNDPQPSAKIVQQIHARLFYEKELQAAAFVHGYIFSDGALEEFYSAESTNACIYRLPPKFHVNGDAKNLFK